LAQHNAIETSASGRLNNALVPSRFIDREKLARIAEQKRDSYVTAKPFPHTFVDGLFPDSLLDAVIADLPQDDKNWTEYDNPNERKRVFSDVNAFAPAAETMAHALNSLPVIEFLEKLTGIENIIPDPYLHAAGYMKVAPGGFLGLHTDFTMHKRLPLERRINVLVYLNRDWKTEWGGQLELHSGDDLNDPGHVEVNIEPIFNRTVIFSTPNALHGHRRPVACPPGRNRLLFSCFYFTVPPALGYRSRAQKVDFPGKNNFSRTATKLANRLLPPIVFDLFNNRK
jgi:Rps23 Pro-64 3,4-dihydroxylase Tpa1-like proline 4-hydroxylase